MNFFNYKRIVLVLLVVSSFYSCQDEFIHQQDEEQVPATQKIVLANTYTLNPELLTGVICHKGVIWFNDIRFYEKITSLLDSETEMWRNNFYASNEVSNLNTEEEIYDKYIETGYNLEAVYDTWEAALSHYSLRKNIENSIDVWLDCRILDTLNSPDDHFIVDETQRSIMNLDCMVAVGPSLYITLPDYDVLEYPMTYKGNNLNTKELEKAIEFLLKIRDKDKAEFKKLHKEGVIKYHPNIVENEYKVEYKNNRFQNGTKHWTSYGKDYWMKVRFGVRNTPIGHYIKATNRIYKKYVNWLGNERWRRSHISNGLAISGKVYKSSDVSNTHNYYGNQTVKNWKNKYKYYYNMSFKIKTGENFSSHWVNGQENSVTKYMTLSW